MQIERAKMTTTHTLTRPTNAPGLYQTENLTDSMKMVCAHYFVGSADWFVIEYDQVSEICFGYARIFKDCGEFGYFSMEELEQVTISSPISIGDTVISFRSVVERDEYWKPKAITTVIAELD